MDTGVGVVGWTGLLDSYHGVGGFSVLLGSRNGVAVGPPGCSELLDELLVEVPQLRVLVVGGVHLRRDVHSLGVGGVGGDRRVLRRLARVPV